MTFSLKLDDLHARAKSNYWLGLFSIFCRVGLAAGFIPSGFVKIMGERFTNLSNNHPMGHYLEALHHTGYYYPFIGVLQMLAAFLLLIPRTALLGAVIYFPIILNICILSVAVRFDGSLISSPFMVLANLYLLCWNYDRLRFILPFKQPLSPPQPVKLYPKSRKFPVLFFAGVLTTLVIVVFTLTHIFELKPYNTLKDCQPQCSTSKNPNACRVFCDCIHNEGMPLDKALDDYQEAVKKHTKAGR